MRTETAETALNRQGARSERFSAAALRRRWPKEKPAQEVLSGLELWFEMMVRSRGAKLLGRDDFEVSFEGLGLLKPDGIVGKQDDHVACGALLDAPWRVHREAAEAVDLDLARLKPRDQPMRRGFVSNLAPKGEAERLNKAFALEELHGHSICIQANE
jgi:hypothetical protein